MKGESTVVKEYSSETQLYALRELRERLCDIPHDEKSAFTYVERTQPHLVNDEHLLGFLRVEEFNIDVRFLYYPALFSFLYSCISI